ncbi:Importin subunit beta-1 [Dichanthelium oligosanthes]|uniref:Importin subunit beta-1 n=1 Tax=Dichanthelium oligosanthes TaxID=888268 RepID=A0A1E5WBY2_9POAL|nr:Importin subunit beta-1 [Dichanthelium oligosanthes]
MFAMTVDTAMNEVSQILLNAQHEDNNIRYAAESDLKQLQECDFPNFLLSLSAELLSNKSRSRRLAGNILKNSLDERYSEDGDPLINQWISLDQLIKSKIKESLLITLGSLEPEAWHASAQVIAKVAYVEIPRQEWPDLIGKLLANMAMQDAPPSLKQATLEALGYVFEEILRLGVDEVNAVLNAVIQAMSQAEQSSEVRLAAVKALQNVLKHANFANDDCRDLIMSAICDTAESDEGEMIKQEAFGCLVVIASKYYTMLEPYMETILSLTTKALKGGVKSGALQCMEFWITICKKVIELREQNKCCFIEKPLLLVVPDLLETLLSQEGDDSPQSISLRGVACLGGVARAIGDAIVPLAMLFVEGCIKASDWQSRKAATLAIYVILEGPSVEKLAPVVCLLLDKMEDPNMEVRGIATCTLRRVFELLHFPARENRIFTYANLPRIVAVLAKRSKDVPEVSEEACGAIYFLAKGYESNTSELGHSKKEISSELSPFVSGVIYVLLSTSALAKDTPFRLPPSASAYEALCEVVKVCNIQDFKALVAIEVLVPRIMRRLNTVLDAKASSSDDERNKCDLLVLLCGVLHVIIQKLGNKFAVWRTPFVLLLFCRVLICKCSTARDKAVLAIGALADATGPDFADHMPLLLQYFNVKLLFPTYLQVIGNIFQVLGERILPYCDCIMGVLYEGVSKSKLKSPILECFGVIALALGKNFEKYLQSVKEKLKEAGNPRYYANATDEDKVDYDNQLIKGKLRAYSNILRGTKDPMSWLTVAADLFEFAATVRKDQSRCT